MKEYDAVFCHGMVIQMLNNLQVILDSERHEPWIPLVFLKNVIGELNQWRDRLEKDVRVDETPT